MGIIQFSPRIYEDEVVYSIVARLILNDLSTSISSGMKNVVGSKYLQLNSSLPSFLPQLAGVTGYKVELLLNHHSLFTYYSMFAAESVRERAKQSLLDGNSSAAYKTLGLLANRLDEKPCIKYCPECVRASEATYGDVIWFRDHQLPLVTLCTLHKCKLIDTPKLRKKFIFPSPLNEPELSDCAVSFKVAHFSQMLPNLGAFEPAKLRIAYLLRLAKRGLATGKSIFITRWRERLRAYYAPLMGDKRVANLLNDNSEHSFPATIFYNVHASHHSVKHILIICFLFEHIDDFVGSYLRANKTQLDAHQTAQVTSQRDLDEGRRNKIREALNKRMSLRMTMKYAKVSAATVRNVAGNLNLSYAGRYRKLSPIVVRSITIKLMGGHRTNEIAEIFDVSLSDVEQVLTGQPELKLLRQRIRFYFRRLKARETLTAAIASSQNFKVKDVKAKCNCDYMWLYKNDKKWLTMHINLNAKR